MHIKQVIIDGFKSYATRTVVNDFDPKFNAITGLNGSGKSNILDAICFVLGITQLSQVRVSNLQGLVYKEGQSGVTKASVTIVFDNSDAESSPVGYKDSKEITVTRQIAIGGRNKYLINGKNAQAKQVQNMFHSVQLNVNNPHFLIMQGRITKVLNMKPPEILGMIEEAAGTRMFEDEKLKAQKKLKEKQIKVDETEAILAQEIKPKVEKLRGEKQSYLKWSAQNRELERLQRFVVAYKYHKSEQLVDEADAKKAGIKDEIRDVTEELEGLRVQIKELKKSESSMDNVAVKGLASEVDKLTQVEEGHSKVLVKATSQLKNRQAALAKLEAKQAKLISQRASFADRLADLETVCAEKVAALEEAEEVFKGSKQAHENAKLGVQAANAGLDNTASQDGGASQQMTMEEKLAHLKAQAEESATLAKQSDLKAKHMKKELTAVEKKVAAAAKKDSKSREQLTKQEGCVAGLEQKLAALPYDAQEAAVLEQQIEEQQDRLAKATDTADALAAQLAAFDFSFSDPSKGFDRTKVKGTVGKLVTLEDAKSATALEVVAGGKLYQVVVDSVQTGKDLLSKGKLKKRVTIIPLDKVSSRTIPKEKLDAAESIAKEKGGSARTALSLVGYDDQVSKAMEYVFGTTLVCDSLATARSVTFNKRVAVRSVTLDGDAFDPQGTLSGGSRPDRGAVLVQLGKLRTAQVAVEELQQSIGKLSSRLDAMRKDEAAYKKLFHDLELAQHQLSLVQERVAATPFAQLESQRQELEKELAELLETAEAAKARSKEEAAEAKDLKSDMQDMEAARSKLVQKAKAELKKAKTALDKAEKALDAARAAADNAQSDIEQLKSDREGAAEAIAAAEKECGDAAAEIAELEAEAEQRKAVYQEARLATDQKKEELDQMRTQLASISATGKECVKQVQAGELKLKGLQADAKRVAASCADAERERRALAAKYQWIESEKQLFGKPQTDYDFASSNPAAAVKRLRELENMQENAGTSINKKVMGMIGKAEQEYVKLNEKREIIKKDRKTIEQVIKNLEAKKAKALQTTWEKVNRDFGSIFSTLLPGTQAKLDPPEDGTILDGLEVKVAFGETWKKSLSELSGGQRSLLALSLILALLLFKPAPMYILDEVDAALDLSHTQNIGQMIRTHFQHSQFIVVSLKEGMFNNANVIFRTKFVDGLSTVRRTANENKPGNENEKPAQKGKAASRKRKALENISAN